MAAGIERCPSNWDKLTELQEILLREKRLKQIKRRCFSDRSCEDSREPLTTRNQGVPRDDILRRIERVIEDILTRISHQQPPILTYNSTSRWDNVQFTDDVGLEMRGKPALTEVRFDAVNSVKKFGITLRVIAMCYKLVQSNTFSTKRDLYYKDTELFGSQSTLDDILKNICCMLNVPRRSLHVLATSKGFIAGDLKFTEVNGNRVDCSTSKTGMLIPAHVQDICNVRSRARFVLVVEKDATFQKLLDDGMLGDMWPCILITGKGFPDVNTRLMVRRLWDDLQIPILGLVDADPHGLEILCVYKFGSKSMSYESHSLTVPCIRWLGVLPSDIDRLQVPRDALIPLSQSDLRKAHKLMQRPYYKHLPDWMKEMQVLMNLERKGEIQCLTAISSDYLTKVYIPNKIRHGGWI
ncbi:meiotic recombination protein SPO11-like [Acanthaster planci]|uniref:DNA topoisomerase (ATP-hydrolyzing) n=1 Tax=Acanthaster planci TaxID=133434 RepID=A0A8B7Y9M9_ACAPL|nr:meiotic recombination protein SPO11-like [Acanthaster planci]